MQSTCMQNWDIIAVKRQKTQIKTKSAQIQREREREREKRSNDNARIKGDDHHSVQLETIHPTIRKGHKKVKTDRTEN